MQAADLNARLDGGFSDPPVQSATAFRALMEAMARPGTIHDVSGAQPPAPLSVAAGVAALVLLDPDVSVHLAGGLDTEAVRDWITFQTGAPIVEAQQATFAFGDWAALHPLDRFQIGLPDYPDRSATLIVEWPGLTRTPKAECAVLSGPGIAKTASMALPDRAAFQSNRALFPQGLDFLFTDGSRLAALPRSTQVE